MSSRSRHVLRVLIAAAVLSGPVVVWAQGQAPADGGAVARTAAEVEQAQARLVREIMSPYCAGLTLADCPSSGAMAIRDDIRGWLREGRSEEWIVDTLVSEWGEGILASPRFSGLGIVAWLAPLVAVALAATAIVAWLRRNAPGPGSADSASPAGVPPAAGGDALRRRVEEEIERLAP